MWWPTEDQLPDKLLALDCLQNFLAWVVAGGFAYYWYVVPEKQRAQEQKVSSVPTVVGGVQTLEV